MPGCERHDLLTLIRQEYIVTNNECVGPLLNKGCKRGVNIAFVARIKDAHILSGGSSCRLDVSSLEVGIRIGRIKKNSDNGSLGNQLA